MMFIAHRINTIAELKQIPVEYGVELDLRDSGKDLILQHEPFMDGELFEDYLQHYKHRFLILNIKSERIEFEVLRLLKKHAIQHYFFLDSSFPMMYQLFTKGEHQAAVRFSEFEKIDTVLALQGKVTWVWIDCFTQLPISLESYQLLKNAGFKLCLVSPELQSRPQDILKYKEFLQHEGILFDAICTKHYNIDAWKK